MDYHEFYDARISIINRVMATGDLERISIINRLIATGDLAFKLFTDTRPEEYEVSIYAICTTLHFFYSAHFSRAYVWLDIFIYAKCIDEDHFTLAQFLDASNRYMEDSSNKDYPLPDQLMRYIVPKLNIYSSSKPDYI